MLAFDAKRAFMNTSGLGNYSRTHLLSLQHFFPSEPLLLFSPKIKIPFLKANDKQRIQCPTGIFRTLPGASYWRSYRISALAEAAGASVFHGLSNELPLNIHKFRMKKVVTLHDLIFIHYPHYYKAFDRAFYLKKVQYACTHADVIVAISEQTKKDLIERLNVPEEKIELVYQDCHTRFHSLAPESSVQAVREKYGLTEPYILSVGTPEARKKQLALLKAFTRIRWEGIQLVLVGRKTAYLKMLFHYIQEHHLGTSVRILTDVLSEELPALYRGALCSAYLSEYEGFGLPLVESLNQEIPVLASNRSCLPEAAGPGALYVNPETEAEVADGLSQLLQNETLRNQLGEKGKQHVQKFRIENNLPSWKKIYEL